MCIRDSAMASAVEKIDNGIMTGTVKQDGDAMAATIATLVKNVMDGADLMLSLIHISIWSGTWVPPLLSKVTVYCFCCQVPDQIVTDVYKRQVWGATDGHQRRACGHRNFNPRSPCGERQMCIRDRSITAALSAMKRRRS